MENVTVKEMVNVSQTITEVWKFAFPDETKWSHPDLRCSIKPNGPLFYLSFCCPKHLKARNKKGETIFPVDPDGETFYGARFFSEDWKEVVDFVEWLSQVERQIMATIKFGRPA